jgi:energy-coupling factor transport system ATP-binding protein
MIEVQALGYRYPNASTPALHNISLSIAAGEFVLLAGPSGSGKSTLLRALNGLVPHFTGGKISGQVRVHGIDPIREGPARMSRVVGMVFQEPESQFVVDVVEDEIAFAMENAGVPREEMRRRIDSVLQQLEITHLRRRAIALLSGGEQQRVAIASALVMQPRVLVLDEPTSQLDDDSAHDVLEAVAKLNREQGLTLVLSEHRLERVQPFAQRVIELEQGRLVEASSLSRHASYVMRDASNLISHEGSRMTDDALRITSLHAGYGDCPVLHGVGMEVRAGEVVALMGRNGAGKSTLLKAIVGLIETKHGEIEVAGRSIASPDPRTKVFGTRTEDRGGRDTADICRDVAYLPQNPNALLFADSVADELAITRRNHGLPALTVDEANTLLAALGMAQYAGAYPRDLSVGERQRAALGAVTAAQPKLLLLDEPTRGLDAESKRKLAEVLRGFAAKGAGVLLVTHDRHLIDLCADRVLHLADGVISSTPNSTST